MPVAKDAVDADILVNNGGTPILRAPRDAAFCKPLYNFSESTLVGEEKPAAGINASSSRKCQQVDFSGIAVRVTLLV